MFAVTNLSGFGSKSSAAGGPVTVSKVTVNVAVHSVNCVSYIQIWDTDGTNPTTQIGNDSDNTTLTGTGDFDYTWTGAEPEPTGDFVMVLRYVSGNVNISYHNSVTDSGVNGGDFEASATVTNLLIGTSIVPSFRYELSDLTTGGQTSQNVSAGFDFAACLGTEVAYTP